MDPERNHKDENNFFVLKALDLWVNHSFIEGQDVRDKSFPYYLIVFMRFVS